MSGGQNGDLYLRVHIKPHSLFKLEGVNVVLDLPLAPWEAALGTEVKVPTLDRSVELNVPAGISSGQKMRLSGRGLGQGAKKGDQLVRVMIKVPKEASEDEKKLWRELAEKSDFKPRMF
jgi:curved DNA-binding protein